LKLYNFKCPNCGATLTTDVKNHHARCEYCGNEFHISEETETSAGFDNQEDGKKTPTVLPERTSEEVSTAGDSERQKKSGSRDFLIVALFLIIGLALIFFFDKESPRDIVPKTDLHRFFTELHPDMTPQNVEALAQKHKLHFFRIDKAVNSDTANINYYKIAKTMDITLGKQDVNAETVEIEFDIAKKNAFRLAVYSDPEHIVSHALLFKYGTYYSLSAEETQAKEKAGYYYYNNSLRSASGEQKTYPPYLKCADAVKALKMIYTYKK